MTQSFMFIHYQISMFFLLTFLLTFSPLRFSFVKSLLLAGCSFCITILLDYHVFLNMHLEAMPFTFRLIEIVIVQGLAFLLSKYRDFRALFIGLTSSAYVLFGNILGVICFYHVSYFLPFIVQAFIHLMLLFFVLWKIRPALQEEIQLYSVNWKLLCFVPALFYGITHALSIYPTEEYTVASNIVCAFLILLLMAISYSLFVNILYQQRKDYELTRNNEYLENYAHRLKHEADIVAENEFNTSVIRHDMRHFSALIHTYLQAGDTDKVNELLLQLNNRLDATTPKRFCKNLAVNGIISTLYPQIVKKAIDFEYDLEIPQSLSVNEFEFATVVSNLLENAINATSQLPEDTERKIKIKSRIVKNQLIFEITNSYSGDLDISSATGLPKSSQGRQHGYGLRGIQAFADKNNAIFDYTLENKEFRVRLLFAIES